MKLINPPETFIEQFSYPIKRSFIEIIKNKRQEYETIYGRRRFTNAIIEGDLILGTKYVKFEFDNYVLYGIIPIRQYDNFFECVVDHYVRIGDYDYDQIISPSTDNDSVEEPF